MTNLEIFNLSNLLNSESLDEITAFKVNYAIEKNRTNLKQEIGLFQSAIRKIDGHKEYSEGRAKIESDMRKIMQSDLTDKEKEIQLNDQEKISKVHEEKFKKVVDKINEILNDKSNFEPYLIDIKDVPITLSPQNTKILFSLIKE